MAEWAERCIAPGRPGGDAARARTRRRAGGRHRARPDPRHRDDDLQPHDAQLNPYGLADWYRYQNLGYQIPLVGGSDKMAASSLLGGIRTYAHLGDREFTYENWMEAVRAGNTFVTVGPLIEFSVAGQPAGSRSNLPAGGGTVESSGTWQSVSVPIDQVEVIVGGLVAEQVNVGKLLATKRQHLAEGRPIRPGSPCACAAATTVAHGEIAAHTSAVQVVVGGKPLFVETDAMAVLDQIEGAIAYVDTLAPRPEAQRYKQLRATLESAHNRLHQRLHQQGIFHRHTPLHRHDVEREH